MATYEPSHNDKFAFGIWCVTNRGSDPFGGPTRQTMSAIDAIKGLARHGAWGFEAHDNDVYPLDATASQISKGLKQVAKVTKDTGIVCASFTTNLFSHPVFKDGAFTSHDPKVRAFALRKVLIAMDAAAELDAKNFIFWGGREGTEVDLSKDPTVSLQRMRDAINFACDYGRSIAPAMTYSIEPKPNEPRGDIYLPAVGNALAFIETLSPANRKVVGVNPEVGHVKMAGLNIYHEFGQAIEAGKLTELHINDQKPLRYDQDLSFGSVSIKEAFLLVKLTVDHKFQGAKSWDAHPYRSEDEKGTWEFVTRNMRTWKILEEKVHQVAADKEIAGLLAQIQETAPALDALCARYSADSAKKIKALPLKADKLTGNRRLPYERLDMLLDEVLMGVR
jgi:xylose isomerase